MHVVTPRIIVAQVFESHEMKKIVFAEKREVSSSQELWRELRINKQQLLLDNNPKLFKLLANTVPLFPFSNFLVCNDKAEKTVDWRWVKMT